MAKCHPDRRTRGHGLCGPCYGRAWRKGELQTVSRATCHPERLTQARGLCSSCYGVRWRSSTPKRREHFDTYSKEWNARKLEEDPLYFSKRDWRRKYKLSAEGYERLYESQRGCCAICDEWQKVLQVDHCHETERVRGLLCGGCNRAIGILNHDPERLARAARYCDAFITTTKKEIA